MLYGEIAYKGMSEIAFVCKSIKKELENLPIEQSFPDDYKQLLSSKFKTGILCISHPIENVLFTYILTTEVGLRTENNCSIHLILTLN